LLYFAERLTIPLLRETGKKTILEIGSSYGNSIRPILKLGDTRVSIIDPGLDADLLALFGDRIILHKGLSLDILPQLTSSYDCIFIDGDHNWYTVFNELRTIEDRNLLNEDGIIFLHDIGWPYGRRDMYYQPQVIPAEYRKPFATRGIVKGDSALVASGGINSGHYNAEMEFGPRNGVLTAVEDFLKQSRHQYYFVTDLREYGFGILLRKSSQNTWRLASSLRIRILQQKYVDPVISAVWTNIDALKACRLASAAKKLRNRMR
jgi:hypothetical protein